MSLSFYSGSQKSYFLIFSEMCSRRTLSPAGGRRVWTFSSHVSLESLWWINRLGEVICLAASSLQWEDEEEEEEQEEVSSLLASPGGPSAGSAGGRCFPCLAAKRDSPLKPADWLTRIFKLLGKIRNWWSFKCFVDTCGFITEACTLDSLNPLLASCKNSPKVFKSCNFGESCLQDFSVAST